MINTEVESRNIHFEKLSPAKDVAFLLSAYGWLSVVYHSLHNHSPKSETMKQNTKHIKIKTGSFISKLTRITAMLMGFMLFALISCGVTDGNKDDDTLSDLEQAQALFEQLVLDSDNKTISFPDEDAGIPVYARVGPILNQYFVTEGRLVIPFYRDPDCIRDDFNFLTYYDPPTAFGCDLTVKGSFVIEKEAGEGEFPIMAHTMGTRVPIWIVDWAEFQRLMEKESVTLPEIEALNPVKGIAQRYEEYLSPRMNEHEVIIEAMGTITGTDQQFTFVLTHRADQIETISLDYE